MSRDSAGVYSKPAGTTAAPNTIIASATFNTVVDDFVQDANLDRPVAAGGTGASTAEGARENLGLVIQSSVSDSTAGRVLLNGAHGLGRSCPELTVADALDSLTRTGWNYVSEANAETVGGPDDAPKGVVWTGVTSSGRYQIYHPMEDDNPSPWRRVSEDGATYGDWLRDLEFGTDDDGVWERRASGWQEVRLAAATFTFSTTSALAYVWTFPVPFSSFPHITAVFSNSGSNYTGFGATNLGTVSAAGTGTSATVLVRRVTGQDDFVDGDTITNVSLHATGLWS